MFTNGWAFLWHHYNNNLQILIVMGHHRCEPSYMMYTYLTKISPNLSQFAYVVFCENLDGFCWVADILENRGGIQTLKWEGKKIHIIIFSQPFKGQHCLVPVLQGIDKKWTFFMINFVLKPAGFFFVLWPFFSLALLCWRLSHFFVFFCFTSLVSLTGFYTEEEP